jgi:hypothetical protein
MTEPRPLTAFLAERLIERAAKAEAAKAARQSFAEFCMRVGRDESDRPLNMDSADLQVIVSVLEECYAQRRHVSIITPPGRGKSTLASLFFLWRIGHDQTLRTVVISGDESGAADRVALCRKTLLLPDYRDIFPSVRPDYERSRVRGARRMGRTIRDDQGWRRDGWFLRAAGQRKDPTMAAIAAVPDREDIRVDMLLADDIITEEIAQSAAKRQRVTNAFWNTWIEGRLANGGWCCYLQNIRSKQDLAHALRGDRRFASVWIGLNDDDRSMFVRIWNPPPRLSLLERPADFSATLLPASAAPIIGAPHAELTIPPPNHPEWTPDKLALKNPVAKKKLYRLQASEAGDLMFPAWKDRAQQPCRAHELLGLTLRNGLPYAESEALARLTFIGGLDLASLKRRGTVLWIVAQDAARKIYPVELHVGKYSDLELVDLLEAIWRRGIRFKSVKVENNALQDRVSKTLEGEAQRRGLDWWGRLEAFHTGANKMHPEFGLPGINTMLHNKQIVWPAAEATSDSPRAGDWQTFEAAMADLPAALDRSATPDEIMAFWFAIENALRNAPGGDASDDMSEGVRDFYNEREHY